MIEGQLSTLDVHALSARLRRLAGEERNVQADFLLHLDALDRRRGYAELGYPSLWEYCLRALHLREGAAGRRIGAMRVLRRFPALLEALRDGRLSLSTLCVLGPVLTPENVEEVAARAAFRTKAETDAIGRARAGGGGSADAPGEAGGRGAVVAARHARRRGEARSRDADRATRSQDPGRQSGRCAQGSAPLRDREARCPPWHAGPRAEKGGPEGSTSRVNGDAPCSCRSERREPARRARSKGEGGGAAAREHEPTGTTGSRLDPPRCSACRPSGHPGRGAPAGLGARRSPVHLRRARWHALPEPVEAGAGSHHAVGARRHMQGRRPSRPMSHSQSVPRRGGFRTRAHGALSS